MVTSWVVDGGGVVTSCVVDVRLSVVLVEGSTIDVDVRLSVALVEGSTVDVDVRLSVVLVEGSTVDVISGVVLVCDVEVELPVIGVISGVELV